MHVLPEFENGRTPFRDDAGDAQGGQFATAAVFGVFLQDTRHGSADGGRWFLACVALAASDAVVGLLVVTAAQIDSRRGRPQTIVVCQRRRFIGASQIGQRTGVADRSEVENFVALLLRRLRFLPVRRRGHREATLNTRRQQIRRRCRTACQLKKNLS